MDCCISSCTPAWMALLISDRLATWNYPRQRRLFGGRASSQFPSKPAWDEGILLTTLMFSPVYSGYWSKAGIPQPHPHKGCKLLGRYHVSGAVSFIQEEAQLKSGTSPTRSVFSPQTLCPGLCGMRPLAMWRAWLESSCTTTAPYHWGSLGTQLLLTGTPQAQLGYWLAGDLWASSQCILPGTATLPLASALDHQAVSF